MWWQRLSDPWYRLLRPIDVDERQRNLRRESDRTTLVRRCSCVAKPPDANAKRVSVQRSRPVVRALGVLLTSLIALSCAQLLGDIQVEAEPTVAMAELSPDVIEATCELGSTRCDGGRLQVCVRIDALLPAGWLDQYDCGSAELCSGGPPAVCLRPTCLAGEASCAGATPRVCNAAQTGWTELPSCASSAHCSTQSDACADGAPCCQADPCELGDLRCNEGRLEECGPDASGWMSRATCDTPELCLSGLAACDGLAASCACARPLCDEGELRCNGSVLERCRLGRTGFDVASECASEALCQRGLTLAPARCEAPACSPGQFTCDGATLRSCRPDLTGFDDIDTCVGPGFCNAAAGQCDPVPCEPGERSCNGAQVQVCAPDQSGFILESDCPLGCVADTGQCQTCEVGTYICSNENLFRCDDGRSVTPLNRNSDCAEGRQIVCTDDGGVVNDCPAGFSCRGNGQCSCDPGTLFCDGDELLVCDGTAIVRANQCQGPDGNILVTCDDGEARTDECDSDDECEDSSGSNCDRRNRGR
jgi:hypothetical protein